MIKRKFERAIRAKAVGSSHGDFGLVIQALDHTAEKQLLSAEVVEDICRRRRPSFWFPVGRKLLYMAPDSRIMVVDYFAQKDSSASAKPRIWGDRQVGPSSFSGMPFYAGPQPFDVSPDGERIVTWQSDEQPNGAKVNLHVTLLMNWFDELHRRLPGEGK